VSDSISIHEILQSWLASRGFGDLDVLQPWQATMSLLPLDRGALLVRAGDYDRHLYFIHSGLLRLFYTSAEGKERNKAFYGPGQATGAVSAAIAATAAPFSIQALEPCLLVQADLNQLYREAPGRPELSRLLIELLADAFIRNEQREAMLLTCSAEQRYQWLVDNEPELTRRLPQFHLASYIGVDAVSLSRLRRKLKPGQ